MVNRMTTRKNIIDQALNCIANTRESVYGDAETNFHKAAELIAVYERGKPNKGYMTPHDIAIHQALLKLARIMNRNPNQPVHIDNYIDIIGYIALAGEIEAEATKPRPLVEDNEQE